MDISWLAAEAKGIHAIFENAFFTFVGTLLVLGVILEYFKLPIGGTPQFTTLLGRALIACLILVAFPEIMNFIADVTDSLARDLGDINKFQLVLARLVEKFKDLSFSWVSVKDVVIVAISYLTFFILYITVYLAETLFTYSWFLIYIFSPVLIGLFVLPQTASATKGLFRTMIEVSLWKVVWASMSALLWSYALSDVNKPDAHIDFLSAIILNLMLAASVLITPKIVSSFASGSLSGVASGLGGFVMSAAALTPATFLGAPGIAVGGAKARAIQTYRNVRQVRKAKEMDENPRNNQS